MAYLLTLEELRARVKTTLEDDDLEKLLRGQEEAISARAGEPGEIVELRWPRGGETVLLLGDSAQSVTSIKEYFGTPNEVLLDADDFYLDGNTLRRRGDGPNSSDGYWHPPLQLTWVPRPSLYDRIRVLIGLIKLELNFNPGLASFTVGAHSETYSSTAQPGQGYDEQREELLRSLTNPSQPLFA